ncbi:MAG: hypothetical protein ACF8GE_07480 [Phycisphaerales bacterium JB043]
MLTLLTYMLVVTGLYLLVGAVFGVVFVVWGITRVDPVIDDSSRSVRLLLLPGCVMLWPLLAHRWARARGASQKESA